MIPAGCAANADVRAAGGFGPEEETAPRARGGARSAAGAAAHADVRQDQPVLKDARSGRRLRCPYDIQDGEDRHCHNRNHDQPRAAFIAVSPPLGPRNQGPIAVSVIFRPPKIVQKFSSAKIPRSWLGSLRTIVVVSAIEILIELNCPVLRTHNLPRYGLTLTFTGELLPRATRSLTRSSRKSGMLPEG